jgi:hypothetical protein
MAYDVWKTTEPVECDERDERREDDEAREAHAAEFIKACQDYAACYGWSSTLLTVAQAKREEEQSAASQDARRI